MKLENSAKAVKVEDDKAEAEEEATAEETTATASAELRIAEETATADDTTAKEAAAIQIVEEEAVNESVAKKAAQEIPSQEAADTETAEISTVNDKAAADNEDYAMKAAKDEAPHTTNVGGAWGECSPDKPKYNLKDRKRAEGPAKSRPSEKPVHRTSLFVTAILLIIAAPILFSTTFLSPCSAPTMSSSSMTSTLSCSSAHSTNPMYMYKAPAYTKSSKKYNNKMFGPQNMMHARYEDNTWPNSQDEPAAIEVTTQNSII